MRLSAVSSRDPNSDGQRIGTGGAGRVPLALKRWGISGVSLPGSSGASAHPHTASTAAQDVKYLEMRNFQTLKRTRIRHPDAAMHRLPKSPSHKSVGCDQVRASPPVQVTNNSVLRIRRPMSRQACVPASRCDRSRRIVKHESRSCKLPLAGMVKKELRLPLLQRFRAKWFRFA